MPTQPVDRTTKYISAVRQELAARGHATNAQLLDAIRTSLPATSATTIHRVTTRLLDAGELQPAPALDGAMRFDANTSPHDHFICLSCGRLRDVVLPSSIRATIEQQMDDGCELSGSLTISGTCKNCKGGK